MAKDGRKNIQLWKLNPDMEKEFIDVCLESAALHGYAGSSLKVWSNIIMALNSKYNQHFDQKALKNKWTSLRGGYMQWRELTHKTGHGYNADNGTFNWPDEVWKAVIQKDNKLAKFKTMPLMYFKELEQLFEGTFATGESKYNFLDVDHDDDDDDVQETQDEQAREAEVYVDIGVDDYLVNSQRAHNTSSCTSVPKSTPDNSTSLGKRKNTSPDFSDVCEMMISHMEGSKNVRELFHKRIEREDETVKQKNEEIQACSIDACRRVLIAMMDIRDLNLTKKVMTAAIMKFCDSVDHRRAFLMEENEVDKMEFLKEMLKPSF